MEFVIWPNPTKSISYPGDSGSAWMGNSPIPGSRNSFRGGVMRKGWRNKLRTPIGRGGIPAFTAEMANARSLLHRFHLKLKLRKTVDLEVLDANVMVAIGQFEVGVIRFGRVPSPVVEELFAVDHDSDAVV